MPRSNWAREPQLLSLRVWSLCSASREAATVRGLRTAMRSGPRSPQLGRALAQKRRPNTPKKKKNEEKNYGREAIKFQIILLTTKVYLISKTKGYHMHLLKCFRTSDKDIESWTSLAAQWLRIHLPMQGTWVRALVWEDPTCRGAAKPLHHNY